MKYLIIAIAVLLSGCTISDNNIQLANPSATLCIERGYEYLIGVDANGSQNGYCRFPDGSTCEGWAYYYGTCFSNTTDEEIIDNIPQSLSSKEVLINVVSDLYDENEAKSPGDHTEGITLIFTPDDALTDTEVARALGAYYNDITISCSNSVPNNMPPESLGCVQYEGITPTADTEAYVYITCAGTKTICILDFAKV